MWWHSWLFYFIIFFPSVSFSQTELSDSSFRHKRSLVILFCKLCGGEQCRGCPLVFLFRCLLNVISYISYLTVKHKPVSLWEMFVSNASRNPKHLNMLCKDRETDYCHHSRCSLWLWHIISWCGWERMCRKSTANLQTLQTMHTVHRKLKLDGAHYTVAW